ncbi:hypothetical protein BC829DRAFT_220884 [Chytridium lagenaria]|nr:hypothetical protein BC829DRAFT_220884 [Chytridium lagenaria]
MLLTLTMDSPASIITALNMFSILFAITVLRVMIGFTVRSYHEAKIPARFKSLEWHGVFSAYLWNGVLQELIVIPLSMTPFSLFSWLSRFISHYFLLDLDQRVADLKSILFYNHRRDHPSGNTTTNRGGHLLVSMSTRRPRRIANPRYPGNELGQTACLFFLVGAERTIPLCGLTTSCTNVSQLLIVCSPRPGPLGVRVVFRLISTSP